MTKVWEEPELSSIICCLARSCLSTDEKSGLWGWALLALVMVPEPSTTSSNLSRDLVGWLGVEIPKGMSQTADKAVELTKRGFRGDIGKEFLAGVG